MTVNIGNNVPEMFHNGVERYQYETFLRYKSGTKYVNMSWVETQRKVINLGLGLISLGVKKGDKIVIFSENRWEWIISDLAILSIGAIDVPIYATSSSEEAAYIINDSGAKFVMVSDKYHLDDILQIRTKFKGVKRIIVFDSLVAGDKETTTLEKVMAKGNEEKDRSFYKLLKNVEPEDLATIIYTSGTSGPPKGVMLSHKNFVSNVRQSYATHPDIGHSDESLMFLPLSHGFGRTVGLYLLIYIGATIAIAEDFSTVLSNLKEIRPTLIASVPRLLEKTYEVILSQIESMPFVKKKMFIRAMEVADRAVNYKVYNRKMPLSLQAQYDIADKFVFSQMRAEMGLERIKMIVNGGGALAVKIDRFFNGIGIPVHNGYGLTETTTVAATNTFTAFEFGSVGPALPDTQVKIEADGEVLIKGPQIMMGYYNQSKATKEVFTDDGWLKTGDIGFIDEKGCLHITDRKKDTIITTGGKSISPQNIENALVTDRFIEQAVVVGEGRKFLTALIIPRFTELATYAKRQGISFDAKEDLIRKPGIVDFYRERIDGIMNGFSRVEQIKKFTLLSHELSHENGELTPTLKLKRKNINEKYATVIEELYRE